MFELASSLQHIITNLLATPFGGIHPSSYGQVLSTIQSMSGSDPFLSNLNFIEKLWASWYIYMDNDILATGLLFFLTHEIMYFGRCLPWFIIDQIPFFNRWKIQANKIVSNKEQWECLKAVLKSHLLVEAIPIWLFHPICSSLKISIEVPFPSIWIMAAQVALFFFLEDTWHYTFHRMFHWGWFYKNIHKVHHKYAAPFGLAAEYAHPAEVMALGVGTVGFPILYAYIAKTNANLNLPSLHLFTVTVWVCMRLLQAVDSHSGYDFPWSLHNFLPFWAGAEHHDDHHHYFIGNYASSFRWYDYFFDSESGPVARRGRENKMKNHAEKTLKKNL